MANRDRVAEILDINRRGLRDPGQVTFEFAHLAAQWKEFPQKNSATVAYFPIRAVTLMEVFARRWISNFVDFGKPYVERAIAFAKNVKLDLELISEVQARTITLGDIIAHSVSLNSFGQVAAVFEALINERFVPRIAKAVERYKVEVLGEPPVPIIADPEAMAGALDRLFRARHILVHEYPKNAVCAVEDISVMLVAAADFTSATHETCTEILYGRVPLSNAGMKEAAARELNRLENELNSVLRYIEADRDDLGKQLLQDTQSRWVSYSEAQCAFRADLTRGGTASGLLWLYEARELAEARLKQMKWYLERDEGEL